jgi:hypothetical protein
MERKFDYCRYQICSDYWFVIEHKEVFLRRKRVNQVTSDGKVQINYSF